MTITKAQLLGLRWGAKQIAEYLELKKAVEEWKEEVGKMLPFFGIRLPLRVKILFEKIRDFGGEATDD